MLVSESVRVEIGSLLLSSAVFTGVDARQRLVWCIPIQSIISQLLDVWTLTGLNSQFESLVFVVQPGFQHWLNQTLHPLVEDGGYSGVVYGYAPQCKRLMDDEPFPFPSESRIPTPSSPPHHTASHPSVIDRSSFTASWKLSPVLPKQWNGSSWPSTALTSSWVSSSNTIPVAMMDVEAGPFSWGFGVGYTGFHRPHGLTALEDGTVW